MDDTQVHPGAERVLQLVRDGEWWYVAESNAALTELAIHRKPARMHPKGCTWWGKTRGFFDGGAKAAPVRAVADATVPLVMPQGNLVQVLGREVRRQRTDGGELSFPPEAATIQNKQGEAR